MTTVVAACVKGADDGTRQAGVRPDDVTPTSRRWCWDTVEVRALTCSQRTARRSGGTLYVRLATGRELPFVDDRVSEAPGGYHYIGRIPQPPLQVVQQYGHEGPPTWIFVNESTGHTAVANDEPVMSPDSSRFATAAQPDWNNCSERDHPSLDIWRFTDSLPVLEWRLDPWDCRRQQGWGPTDPHWRRPDTLEFLRNEQIIGDNAASASRVAERRLHAIAVRDSNGWHVIAQ